VAIGKGCFSKVNVTKGTTRSKATVALTDLAEKEPTTLTRRQFALGYNLKIGAQRREQRYLTDKAFLDNFAVGWVERGRLPRSANHRVKCASAYDDKWWLSPRGLLHHGLVQMFSQRHNVLHLQCYAHFLESTSCSKVGTPYDSSAHGVE
jgi:hypothetical protein